MWEYVKGSEADFEGAPEWATLVTNGGDISWFVEAHKKGAKVRNCNSGDIITISEDWGNWPDVIAERRKVDNLQSRLNDANLQQTFDTVQRPAHYNQSGIECNHAQCEPHEPHAVEELYHHTLPASMTQHSTPAASSNSS